MGDHQIRRDWPKHRCDRRQLARRHLNEVACSNPFLPLQGWRRGADGWSSCWSNATLRPHRAPCARQRPGTQGCPAHQPDQRGGAQLPATARRCLLMHGNLFQDAGGWGGAAGALERWHLRSDAPSKRRPARPGQPGWRSRSSPRPGRLRRPALRHTCSLHTEGT